MARGKPFLFFFIFFSFLVPHRHAIVLSSSASPPLTWSPPLFDSPPKQSATSAGGVNSVIISSDDDAVIDAIYKNQSFGTNAVVSRRIVVDQHPGRGQFNRIQAAINSVPDFNSHWVLIQINPGVYNEKVTIPYQKACIILQGAGQGSTIITWNDRATNTGTANSATFSALASNFVARGITFRNNAPPPSPGAYGGQAVAVLLSGDKMAFYDCGFIGSQDTLFDYQGRHYFKNCYIEGSIDFIFGHAQSIYKGCTLNVKAQSGFISGSIAAHNRNTPIDGGAFVFVGCTITGSGEVYLGRAWGAYSRVVYLLTSMSNIILPQGWNDWGVPSRQRCFSTSPNPFHITTLIGGSSLTTTATNTTTNNNNWGQWLLWKKSGWWLDKVAIGVCSLEFTYNTVYYGEYKCKGAGSNRARRVKWSRELSDAEARPFLSIGFIDGGSWLQEI